MSVYVPRWSAVTESESLSSLFAWAWQTRAAARAQDFSITRNETTRLRPKTRRLNEIIHSGRGEWMSSGCFDME